MNPSTQVHLNRYLLCTLVLRQEPPPCSVCLDGAEFEYGSRQMPATQDTCDSMQEFLDAFPDWNCDLLHEIIFSINDFIDVPSFCGCVGAPIPNLCDACDDQTTMETTRSISFHDGRSCSDLEIVYPFVTDEYICQDLREACCNDVPECGVCALGSYLGTPELQVPFFESATCASIDSDLSFVPANSCSDYQDQMNSLFDVAAWCGCEGATSPNECSLCPDGYVVANENVEIPDSNGLTCGLVVELVPYAVDPQFCEEFVSVISGECCKPAPPTSAPVADPDESSGTTNALVPPFAMTSGGIFYLGFW
jgi:hypothetical protein